mmetsp:Transcript_40364/g.63132  ORF Transcript_40364/g.63132 Transcript_40364/m.63132 type:complete len:319 (-) Transcript_40364:301-1257(-)
MGLLPQGLANTTYTSAKIMEALLQATDTVLSQQSSPLASPISSVLSCGENASSLDDYSPLEMHGERNVQQKYLKTKERNRLHARKSRERQKNLITALKQDMCLLQAEFHRLKGAALSHQILTPIDLDLEGDGNINVSDDKAMEIFALQGDYTLPSSVLVACEGSDSHKLRKERNRIHAKKTRDRKKNFITNANQVLFRLGMKINRLVAILNGNEIFVTITESAKILIQNPDSNKKSSRRPSPSTQPLAKRRRPNNKSADSMSVSPGFPDFHGTSSPTSVAEDPDLAMTAILLSNLKTRVQPHAAVVPATGPVLQPSIF